MVTVSVPEHLLDFLREMYHEMSESYLDVMACPNFADESMMQSGRKLRVVTNKNPDWYRQLCARYPKSRTRPRRRKEKYTDSKVCRRDVLVLLQRLLDVGKSRSIYTGDLIEIAQGMYERMEEPPF